MKIRSSFVSNSSSASFIITVPMKESDLANLLYQNTATFDAVNMYYKLKEAGKFFSESNFKSEKGPEFLKALELFKITERKFSEKHTTKYYEIPDENVLEVVKVFLKANGMHFEKNENEVQISASTIIYNDFEDFGIIIQKLVYLFTVTNTPFTWKVVEDADEEEIKDI